MERGSQAQDYGLAIYTKIQYSVSSTFATGCSIEQTWKGLAILVQMMLIVQKNDRNRVGKPRSLWGLRLTVTAWLFGRGGENVDRTFHKFSKKRDSFEFGLILRIRQIWKDDFSLSS